MTAKLGLLHEHMLIRIKNDRTSTDEGKALQSSLKSNHVISVKSHTLLTGFFHWNLFHQTKVETQWLKTTKLQAREWA